jgi:type VII secretion ATPase EccA
MYKHPQDSLAFFLNPPQIGVVRVTSFDPTSREFGVDDAENAEIIGGWTVSEFQPGVWTQLYDSSHNPLPLTLNVTPPATVYAAWYQAEISAASSITAFPGDSVLPATAGAEARPAASASKADEPERAGLAAHPRLDELMAELNEMIGLAPVKEAVSAYVKVVQNQEQRRRRGLKVPKRTNHLVFTGPPGTGKTTVARLVGKIFLALGVLEKDTLKEVSRSDLVAEYMGQTATKTNKVIEAALGGVLFIDEAYTLAQDDTHNDYGQEAIAVLLKRMEDDRERLVVIAAGYETPMGRFLNSNPGLKGRFSRTIAFPDYDPRELMLVLDHFARSEDYQLTRGAAAQARKVLEQAWSRRDETFANARLVRNLFEAATEAQAVRLAGGDDSDTAAYKTLQTDDIPDTV